MEERKEAMMKRLASRHEQRLLKTVEQARSKKIDLRATEKAFLEASPSAVDMKTPINPATKSVVIETMSPILSFDEKADKQMVAIATWCNTMLGLDDSEEMDLGATKAEACKRIQKMLVKKSDGEMEDKQQQARPRYHRIFEKYDWEEIKRQCRELLKDSGIDESANEMLSKNFILVRNELSIYSDLALQTSLLRVFLSFHPVWLKAALEAIFDTKIEAQPKFMVGAISRFFVEHVFTNQRMLKNKKFAQGSGRPIVTPVGKEALHRHFLLITMKLMFLIETAHLKNVIPNLTRIFTKSSCFKSLDELFSELTKELLSGSSASLKRAFQKIGFTPSYKQSFIESYDYQARGFDSFSDGLILAKLVETVGEMPHGKLLSKLRDPAGDRIRKVNNVKAVFAEMSVIGISTEDVTPANIVAGKKEAVLAVLWNIIGVRVAKEKRIHTNRAPAPELEKAKKRRSAVHDDMSSEVLKMCKTYARELDVEVSDLESLADGHLLSKAWSWYVPNGTPVETFEGTTLWEKVVMMADVELHIARGIDQNMALFVKTFFERMQMVRVYNENAEQERPSLATSDRSTSPASVSNATFNVPCASNTTLSERPSLSQFSERQSIDSTFDNATFTLSRESVDSNCSMFKMPKTPSRVTFVKSAMVHMIGQVIEEEENEAEDTIVPSTAKKRALRVENVFEKSPASSEKNTVEDTATENTIAEEDFTNEYVCESQMTVLENLPLKKESDIVIDGQNEGSNCSKNVPGDELNDLQLEKTEAVSEKTDLTCADYGNALPVKSEPTVTDDAVENVTDFEVNREEQCCAIEPATIHEVDDKENIYRPKEREMPQVECFLTEEQKKMEEFLNSAVMGQKQYVERNHLDVVIENENASTPELRKILRETLKLKRKQQEIANMLGKIERQALAEKREEAFIESTALSDIDDQRSDAGHDDEIACEQNVFAEEPATCFVVEPAESLVPIELDVAPRMSVENAAASVIQKLVRGFLARRRLRAEIEIMKERVVVYNKVLADEDQMFTKETSGDTSITASSAETKLRNYSLYGLTDANLHIVNLAATIIDRLTDLVPTLLEKFVVDLNGVKLIYNILEVADRGYSYMAILHPLLNVLQKSFTKVPEEKTNTTILPLLPKLSPRLLQLMLAHCTNKNFFMAIATTLTLIGRRFPNKKTSRMENSTFFVTKSMTKVTDAECKRTLVTLQTVCDALL